MVMKEATRNVFDFLKANHGRKLVNAHVAAELGVSGGNVVCCMNNLVKAGLGERIDATVLDAAGKKTNIRYLTLTPEGLAFDPDAVPEATDE